jgi:trehalose 6-phosphate phosphatase
MGERLLVNSRQGERKNAKERIRKAHRKLARARGARGARHLFDCWPQVVRSLYSAQSIALFVDFDGTLTPLRERPSDVPPLDPSWRRILRRLARCKRLTFYAISGRQLAELRKLVPVPGVRLLGLHGWEGRDVPPLDKERGLVRKARQLLQQRLSKIPQIWLEDKGLGLAVHYRGAPLRSIRLARPIVPNVARILGPHIHILRGDKVWEILPRQIDGKGTSVRALLSQEPPGMLPIFVGDDLTDEHAFAVLPHGLTVRVGKNLRTRARFLLRNPEEVKVFLQKLEVEIV